MSNVKIVTSSNTADLTIKNLTVTNESDSVIEFGSGKGNKLTLVGTNKLKTSDTWAAVVNVGGGLTIDGTGSLEVTAGTQGSGIGYNSYGDSNANIIINGGTIIATADMGAGIGSGSNGSIGNITINTVSVNATSKWGKGIGAGCYGLAGNVSITIVGDEGDDILVGTSETDTFAYTGGNDVITNYSGEDIIHIAQGKLDSYSFDGGDLIFHIGDGSIRLKNMTNHAITVKDSSGKTTTKIYGTGYSGHEVIKNFVRSTIRTVLPDNELRIDEAIKSCSHFNSLEEVVNQMVSDCEKAGNADTFLRDYCGIILDNKDSGAPTGWDAGGLTMKIMSDLIPEIGEATYPESTTFVKQGVTVTVPDKDTLTEKEKLIVKGFYSWWAEGAFKLIEETYGISLKGHAVELKFSNEPDKGYWGTGGTVVTVNMAYTQDITETYNAGVDGLFSHELTHFMQAVFGHLGNMYRMYPYMIEGMANLTGGSGGTFASSGNPIQLAKDLALVNNDGNDCYDVGYMFWRYLMKQASDSYDSSKDYVWEKGSSISGTDDAELLTGSGKNVTISAGKGNDTITVYGKNMKAFGNEDNDYILIGSVASNAKVYGGAGDDSIYNAGANVTISGYTGNDYIENDGGANVSISGGAGDDSILNAGSQVKIYANDGNDSVKNSSANVTISGYIGNDHIINEGGANVSINGGSGADTISNNLRSEYNWDNEKWEVVSSPDNVKIISGSGDDSIENFGRSVTISGNNGNDTITNRAEGATSSINGGKGNDSINNWAGEVWNEETQKYDIMPSPDNVTIVGGTGNDTIYNEGSKVSINGGANKDLLINGGYWENERGGFQVSIHGSSGNDTLISHGSKSVLNGGSDNDLIYNGYRYYQPWNAFYDSDDENYNGNDTTIFGGTGNDTIKNSGNNVVFKYAKGDGNDSIVGFNANSTLIISDSTYSTIKSNSDVIVKVGKGKITLAGAADLNKINIERAQTITNSTKSPLTLGSAFYVADASDRTTKVKIAGNNLDNTIIGSPKSDTLLGVKGNDKICGNAGADKLYGGSGKDTLIGGKGNDSLWGNTGADTFIYDEGDGKDVIYGFDNKDTLTLDGLEFKSSYKNNAVTLKFSSGSITFKDFTATTFHIDNDLYKVSSSKLVKQ